MVVVFQYIRVGELNTIMVSQVERVLGKLLVFEEAVGSLEEESEPQRLSS